MHSTIADRIAQLAHAAFDRQMATGGGGSRPRPGEWTVLSAIVVEDTGTTSMHVLTWGTGVKCLPPSRLPATEYDNLLHDCHAEVIVRRSLIRHILLEIIGHDDYTTANAATHTTTATCSVLERVADRQFRLRPSIRFHLYVSQAPCGDASMTALARELGEQWPVAAITASNEYGGAVCYRGRDQLRRLGVLRTKPGRADAETTDSMSCSDKLALWNQIGLEGALASQFLEPSSSPLRYHSVVIGQWFDLEALTRSFYYRFNLHATDQLQLLNTSVQWRYRKANDGDVPANNSLNWLASEADAGVEVLVNGRKQGACVDKKTGLFPTKTRSRLCRSSLLDLFNRVRKNEEPGRNYSAVKQLNSEYRQRKDQLLNSTGFQGWIRSAAAT